jgi:hypothetical protein
MVAYPKVLVDGGGVGVGSGLMRLASTEKFSFTATKEMTVTISSVNTMVFTSNVLLFIVYSLPNLNFSDSIY